MAMPWMRHLIFPGFFPLPSSSEKENTLNILSHGRSGFLRWQQTRQMPAVKSDFLIPLNIFAPKGWSQPGSFPPPEKQRCLLTISIGPTWLLFKGWKTRHSGPLWRRQKRGGFPSSVKWMIICWTCRKNTSSTNQSGGKEETSQNSNGILIMPMPLPPQRAPWPNSFAIIRTMCLS